MYQGVKEFHRLAHISCYSNIMVCSPFKLVNHPRVTNDLALSNLWMPLKCTVKISITKQYKNGAVVAALLTKLQPHGSELFHHFYKYNSCGTEKGPLPVNGTQRQEWPLGGHSG